MSQFSGKVFFALAAGSIVLAISAPAAAKPNPREVEATRLEMQRAAQLRHARDMRASASRNASQQRPMFGWPAYVTEARKYIGTNPTAMQRRWCARFLNLVLNKSGYRGTNSDAARSFASYGRRINEPRIGAIAVLTRGKSQTQGHVGIVTGMDANGNPIIISGNHGRRVAESTYPRSRVIAYVMPTDGPQMTQIAAAGPARANDSGGISSPIAELLAAINAESAPRSVAPSQPTVQLAAQSKPRPEQQAVRPARIPVAQVVLPPVQAVPQPRPAPYWVVQQLPSPTPDPRRVN